jgi:hypothetical protein
MALAGKPLLSSIDWHLNDVADQANRRSQTAARVAGFMYLFGIAAFMSGNALLGSVFVQGSFTSEARAVASAHEAIRAAFVLMLATSWSNVVLIGALYVLLRPFGQSVALVATLWRMIDVGLGSISCVFRFVSLKVYAIPTASPCCLQQQLLLSLTNNATKVALDAADLFFAAGSCAFFALFYRSRLIPKWLSGLGLVASAAIFPLGIAELLQGTLPSQLDLAWLPIIVAELATGIWLLFGSGLQARLETSSRGP